MIIVFLKYASGCSVIFFRKRILRTIPQRGTRKKCGAKTALESNVKISKGSRSWRHGFKQVKMESILIALQLQLA